MEYPLAKAFDSLSSEGVAKVIAMIKLALKELPRLHTALVDPKLEKEARREILWLFETLDRELKAVQLLKNMTGQELAQALYKKENFSPEEWVALEMFWKLFDQHRSLIFTPGGDRIKQPKFRHSKA